MRLLYRFWYRNIYIYMDGTWTPWVLYPGLRKDPTSRATLALYLALDLSTQLLSWGLYYGFVVRMSITGLLLRNLV